MDDQAKQLSASSALLLLLASIPLDLLGLIPGVDLFVGPLSIIAIRLILFLMGHNNNTVFASTLVGFLLETFPIVAAIAPSATLLVIMTYISSRAAKEVSDITGVDVSGGSSAVLRERNSISAKRSSVAQRRSDAIAANRERRAKATNVNQAEETEDKGSRQNEAGSTKPILQSPVLAGTSSDTEGRLERARRSKEKQKRRKRAA